MGLGGQHKILQHRLACCVSLYDDSIPCCNGGKKQVGSKNKKQVHPGVAGSCAGKLVARPDPNTDRLSDSQEF